MPLPGVVVDIADAASPPAQLNNTGTAFITGLSDRGATSGNLATADAVVSLPQFRSRYGVRQTYNGPEYDAVEAFFTEGGSRLFFSRIAGPAAVRASAAVPASSSKFTATAKGPGSYGNNLTVSVASGVITVKESTAIVEVSPVLADTAEAQAWASANSDYIDITPLASGALSDATNVALTAGADDRTNITDTERQAALDRFGSDLGPGQVLMPGDTRTAAHTMLANHAVARNRFAYGDLPDTATVATITAAAAAVRGLGREVGRHIQLLEPWLLAPADGGTTRTVPPSGVQAGIAARLDNQGNPNIAVAGRNAVSRFATGVKYTRSDTDREALADAGVTVIRSIDGQVQPYDDITPVNQTTEPEWLGAAGNRLVMRIIADAQEVARSFMFQPVAGPADLAAFRGAMTEMLAGWFNRGALYSQDGTPAGAFRVEVGPTVNTPETLAARQLRAELALKLAPNARQVNVTITNTPLNGTV